MNKSKVYICSSLRPEVVKRVDEVLLQIFDENQYHMLRPHTIQPEAKEELMSFIRGDGWMLDQADEVWVIGQFGNDCQWELGYAMAKGKPVTIFKDSTNTQRIEDSWMYRLGYDLNLLTIKEL